ncbi:hypothetical protein EG68_12191 [Paragonimus skrjabini miyazakii]|uniref:Uncharacterized protein n=1 Tax=Paragonimus skrjabini miyazakii TaxID=59628 RepID=A0A8S9YK23_9TREM|nr:hypothetical protein EG68_12191 [Paragonimus skrjabini miyazakii]
MQRLEWNLKIVQSMNMDSLNHIKDFKLDRLSNNCPFCLKLNVYIVKFGGEFLFKRLDA